MNSRNVKSLGRRQTGDMPISSILMLALIVIPLVLGGIWFLQSSFTKAKAEAGDAVSQADEAKKAAKDDMGKALQ